MADDLKFVIPLAHGIAGAVKRAINADTDGLRTMLMDLIRTNPTAHSGMVIAVRPTTDGRWVLPARPTGAVFLFLPGTAPLPTAADGVTEADLIAVTGAGVTG